MGWHAHGMPRGRLPAVCMRTRVSAAGPVPAPPPASCTLAHQHLASPHPTCRVQDLGAEGMQALVKAWPWVLAINPAEHGCAPGARQGRAGGGAPFCPEASRCKHLMRRSHQWLALQAAQGAAAC